MSTRTLLRLVLASLVAAAPACDDDPDAPPSEGAGGKADATGVSPVGVLFYCAPTTETAPLFTLAVDVIDETEDSDRFAVEVELNATPASADEPAAFEIAFDGEISMTVTESANEFRLQSSSEGLMLDVSLHEEDRPGPDVTGTIDASGDSLGGASFSGVALECSRL